ncbi:MAG: DNA-binding response regulator [Oceanicaulis sp.]|jgi:two-component system response regulator DesR|uniref:response regulator transcription factor n=1 Tax=unclassified Oceanicaulis TaxID=2632123 RepID=UPI0000668B08|nr:MULTISPECIES: response regulator transcription factor [unclassified Oceanicaulis]EAP90280.1 DNA-binding response regulator [Oceanicaulis alexandrii HTCC2633] [Oceanicaulis sp. HTCC2633]MBC39720.1 DNA-binding response regulator [Oceanicaulis sp.]MBG35793.1 DNA-binding response regulator [Oceanicaulis sp.]HBU62617.1 DNA-binding response regulator [Oceanicaulis sp.]HCR94154.1 DNA-binding response regulator [Oceanicaulis sp.]
MISIVIAEDQSLLRGALAALLTLEPDIELLAQAQDGEEAVRLVHELKPDVLVTDIEMPGLTGIEASEALRQSGSDTRVLIVTTFARPGYLQRALQAGVLGYVLKDAPSEELADAVRRVAQGQRAIASELAETAWSAPVVLTARERDILRLVEEGKSNKEIARLLNLSPGTVRNYLAEATQKLGAANRIEAFQIARENGWL